MSHQLAGGDNERRFTRELWQVEYCSGREVKRKKFERRLEQGEYCPGKEVKGKKFERDGGWRGSGRGEPVMPGGGDAHGEHAARPNDAMGIENESTRLR